MAYELQQTGDLTRTAEVNIPANEYEADVNRALRQLSKRVKIRGFRKGKIPLSVMKQRYGDAVQRDVIENLVRRHVNEIVAEAKAVLFISTPEVKEVPLNGNGVLQFTVDLELRPEIDPVGYLGVEIAKPEVSVADEEIQAELEKMQKSHASMEAIEDRDTIEDGDVVTFSFQAVGDDEDLEQFQGDNAQVQMGEGLAMPGIEDALKGAKFDAEVTASVSTDDQFGVEELRNREFDVKINVSKVERRVLPELDDQFAKDSGEAESIDALRNVIRERLEHQKEHEAGHVAENNLIDALLDSHDFELPPQFFDEQLTNAVRQQLQQFQQQGVDLAQLNFDLEAFKDSMREDREKQIKAEFLLVAIAEKEKIKVDESDLKAYFEHQALHMNVAPEMLQRYMAQDQQRMQQASASALLEKTVNHLLGEATITAGEWPSADAPAEKAEKPAKKAKKSTKKAEAKAEAPAEEAPAAEAPAAGGYDADAAREAFGGMTVAELKDLLRDADLKVGGKKGELVDRLVEAEIAP